MKSLNSKEYMECINAMGVMGSMNHIVHAEPKWNVGNTTGKDYAGDKDLTGLNATQMPQIHENNYSNKKKQSKIKEQCTQEKTKSDMTAHMDCMAGISEVNMVIMGIDYFYMHAEPITEYNFRQAQIVGIRSAIKEAALLGLLVGMGFNHDQAYVIVDKWKKTQPL